MIELVRPLDDVGTVYSSSDEAVTRCTLPSRLLIPRVDTVPYDVSDPNLSLRSETCDIENHPVIAFAITAYGFSSVTGANHAATSYYIEDMYSNVIWKSEFDNENLTVKRVDNIVLPENKVFRVRAVFHSSTGDVSDAGTKTFITKRKNHSLKSFFTNFAKEYIYKYTSETMKLGIPFELGVAEVKIVIEEYIDSAKRTIVNTTLKADDPYLTLDRRQFSNNAFYFIFYKTINYKEGTVGKLDTNNIEDKDYWECISFNSFIPMDPSTEEYVPTLRISNGGNDYESLVFNSVNDHKANIATIGSRVNVHISNIKDPNKVNLTGILWLNRVKPPYKFLDKVSTISKGRVLTYNIEGNKPCELVVNPIYRLEKDDPNNHIAYMGRVVNTGATYQVSVVNNTNFSFREFSNFTLKVKYIESNSVKCYCNNGEANITSKVTKEIIEGLEVKGCDINISPNPSKLVKDANGRYKFEFFMDVKDSNNNTMQRKFIIYYGTKLPIADLPPYHDDLIDEPKIKQQFKLTNFLDRGNVIPFKSASVELWSIKEVNENDPDRWMGGTHIPQRPWYVRGIKKGGRVDFYGKINIDRECDISDITSFYWKINGSYFLAEGDFTNTIFSYNPEDKAYYFYFRAVNQKDSTGPELSMTVYLTIRGYTTCSQIDLSFTKLKYYSNPQYINHNGTVPSGSNETVPTRPPLPPLKPESEEDTSGFDHLPLITFNEHNPGSNVNLKLRITNITTARKFEDNKDHKDNHLDVPAEQDKLFILDTGDCISFEGGISGVKDEDVEYFSIEFSGSFAKGTCGAKKDVYSTDESWTNTETYNTFFKSAGYTTIESYGGKLIITVMIRLKNKAIAYSETVELNFKKFNKGCDLVEYGKQDPNNKGPYRKPIPNRPANPIRITLPTEQNLDGYGVKVCGISENKNEGKGVSYGGFWRITPRNLASKTLYGLFTNDVIKIWGYVRGVTESDIEYLNCSLEGDYAKARGNCIVYDTDANLGDNDYNSRTCFVITLRNAANSTSGILKILFTIKPKYKSAVELPLLTLDFTKFHYGGLKFTPPVMLEPKETYSNDGAPGVGYPELPPQTGTAPEAPGTAPEEKPPKPGTIEEFNVRYLPCKFRLGGNDLLVEISDIGTDDDNSSYGGSFVNKLRGDSFPQYKNYIRGLPYGSSVFLKGYVFNCKDLVYVRCEMGDQDPFDSGEHNFAYSAFSYNAEIIPDPNPRGSGTYFRIDMTNYKDSENAKLKLRLSFEVDSLTYQYYLLMKIDFSTFDYNTVRYISFSSYPTSFPSDAKEPIRRYNIPCIEDVAKSSRSRETSSILENWTF